MTPAPRGTFAVTFEEPRGPKKRLRFTRIERRTPGTWWQTTEELTGCGWRILDRERVDDVSLEMDAPAVATGPQP
ncbi:hypothetical protein G9C85_02580 [Halorubellus sp. JP-L1]|uniref:hypothetical protein n=1 Tax=Halorubellus sp. JP-L1 TaxID=2715753 RepID=UPI00140C108F|nr:hypothetical protein [Halorubellus sp. JP-L1]NHN40524.1 hypothetical protein [Halorubellus sp. JP-L1]